MLFTKLKVGIFVIEGHIIKECIVAKYISWCPRHRLWMTHKAFVKGVASEALNGSTYNKSILKNNAKILTFCHSSLV